MASSQPCKHLNGWQRWPDGWRKCYDCGEGLPPLPDYGTYTAPYVWIPIEYKPCTHPEWKYSAFGFRSCPDCAHTERWPRLGIKGVRTL